MQNATSRWTCTDVGVVYEREVPDGSERVWINPSLVAPLGRTRYRLRVDVLGGFEDLGSLNTALLVLGDFFARDSVLAAIAAKGSATRIVVYTATWPAVVRERYHAVCAVLGDVPIGLHVETDTSWDLLAELQSLAGWDVNQPASSERCG